MRVCRGSQEIFLRIERRPGSQHFRRSLSSDLVTEDTILRIDMSTFQVANYYHISITICEEQPHFTLLGMCAILAHIRRVGPSYSLTNATHCFWFCTAFLIQMRNCGYSLRPVRKSIDWERRGRFKGFRTLDEEWVEKMLDDIRAAVPIPPQRPFMNLVQQLVSKSSYALFGPDSHKWKPESVKLESHSSLVTSVCFTPGTGRYIVSSSNDRQIHLLDATTGALVHRFMGGHDNLIYAVAVSPFGQRIASTSSDRTLRIWDVDTRIPIHDPLEGHVHTVSSVAFSPDGNNIVSGSYDGSLLVWDTQTATIIGQRLEDHNVYDVAEDTGRSPVNTNDESDEGTDADEHWHTPIDGTSNAQAAPMVRVMSVAWSSDGARIVSSYSDGTIRLWDAELHTLLGKPLRGHEGPVTSVAFSPDGRRIVSGSKDRTVRIWSTASGEELLVNPYSGHTALIHCIAFSPNGKWVASGSSDKTIRIWNTYEDEADGPAATLDAGSAVWSLAWSPTTARDQIAGGCEDGKIRTWARNVV